MFDCKDCNFSKTGKYLEYKCPCFCEFPHENYSVQEWKRDTVSQMYRAYCLLYGYRAKKDESKAISILKKLSKDDFAPAQYILSDCYYRGVGVKHDLTKAFELCKKAADARCNLAVIQTYKNYMLGIGTNEDGKMAKKYCHISVILDNKELYSTYADMCNSEEYGEKDIKEACKYYQKAYVSGNKDVFDALKELHKNNIEKCYEAQHGMISNDPSLALHCNEKFADYCVNNGFFRHIKTAIKHYRIALGFALEEARKKEEIKRKVEENGCTDRYERQVYEYDKYFDRFGIEVNGGLKSAKEIEKKIEKCLSYYFEEYDVKNKELFDSALSGQAWAQNNIGCLFYDSNYELYDLEDAKKWFSRAADQGIEQATNNLKLCEDRIEALEKARQRVTEFQSLEDRSSDALDEQMRMNERWERTQELIDITTFSTDPSETAAAHRELYESGYYGNK